MTRRLLGLLASLLMLAGLGLAAADTADAHSPCTGTCNNIQVLGDVGIGIYDYGSSQQWSFIQNPNTWSNSWNLYQQDVEGFWIGGRTNGRAWCFQVWQGSSGPDTGLGYWGVGRGPYHFTTTYWRFNKVYVWSVPENDRC